MSKTGDFGKWFSLTDGIIQDWDWLVLPMRLSFKKTVA
jgi:hypothetical protein